MAGPKCPIRHATGVAARRWMQVQNNCQVCPVCKAGIDHGKVRIPNPKQTFGAPMLSARKRRAIIHDISALRRPQPATPAPHASDRARHLCCQVVPIYGRGGDNADPRKRTSAAEAVELKNAEDAVPMRPAGQRAVPVQVRQGPTHFSRAHH